MSGITLESLRGSKYPDELIDELKSGNLAYLLRYSTKMNSVDFMRDLIYAVKEEHGTYDVFLYYSGPAVQQNEKIATEIFREAPELIQRTVLSGDREFIKKNLADCPGIVAYIDEDLKNDQKFRAEVAKAGITIEPGITQEIVQDIVKSNAIIEMLTEDSSLSSDPNFMLDAIKEDAEFLNNAASDLRENPNFMRIASAKNEDVIDMVVQQIEDFNFDAIQAVRESSRELTLDDCFSLIDQFMEMQEEREKTRDPDAPKTEEELDLEKLKAQLEKTKGKIQEKGLEDPHTMKWITAVVARMDDVSPELMKKILDYSMLTMEKTKKDIGEDGEMHVDIGVATALIKPEILEEIVKKVKAAGHEVDSSLEERLASYKEFSVDFQKRLSLYKEQNRDRLIAEALERKAAREAGIETIGELEIEEEHAGEHTEDGKVVSLQGNGGLLEAIGETGMIEITEVESEVKRDAKEVPGQNPGAKIVKDSVEMDH